MLVKQREEAEFRELQSLGQRPCEVKAWTSEAWTSEAGRERCRGLWSGCDRATSGDIGTTADGINCCCFNEQPLLGWKRHTARETVTRRRSKPETEDTRIDTFLNFPPALRPPSHTCCWQVLRGSHLASCEQPNNRFAESQPQPDRAERRRGGWRGGAPA